jgi:sulfate/thiosulfate transport system substrate-binding protein
MKLTLVRALRLILAVSVVGVLAAPGPVAAADKSVELLNASYDPTRELWKALNAKFIPQYEKKAGIKLSIKQSHGGSAGQARSVIEGLEADVVTLAIWGDTDAIRKAGLIKGDWAEKFPNGSLPYYSTIVFVVRKGNPKGVKDWPDLVKKGVEVITPSPKTSGNGKLSFLSAWGSVIKAGGSESDAQRYVTELYQHVPVLDTGARGATVTFSQKGIGDVHLTWENEAHLEIAESKGELEIIYPSTAIRAEPRVAIVDAVVDQKGTRKVAEAYLNYLYTDEAQEIIAKNYYRPSKPETLKAYAKNFPNLKLFAIKEIAKSWDDADARFFAEGGVFDKVFTKPK